MRFVGLDEIIQTGVQGRRLTTDRRRAQVMYVCICYGQCAESVSVSSPRDGLRFAVASRRFIRHSADASLDTARGEAAVGSQRAIQGHATHH